MAIQIAPSFLSADFAYIADEVQSVEHGGADLLHVDIMDGRFVPNITFGPAVVEAIHRHTRLALDVHLMIEEPDRYVATFAAAGADCLSVHVEACRHLHRVIEQIRSLGVKTGVAINPATPIETVTDIAPEVDRILIMTINPGFGGQRLIETMVDKVRRLRSALDERGLDVPIEVDGGVNEDTAAVLVQAGAEILVAGSSVFLHEDRADAIRRLRLAAKAI